MKLLKFEGLIGIRFWVQCTKKLQLGKVMQNTQGGETVYVIDKWECYSTDKTSYDFFLSMNNLLFFMSDCFICQKRVSDSLVLELWVVVSYHDHSKN